MTTTGPRPRLEQVWRWRQVAVWAPVGWVPVVLHALLSGRTSLALAIGIAGLLFAGLARSVVWLGCCPGCRARWRESQASFQTVWDEAKCRACGLSLFELRREGRQQSRSGRKS